VSEKQPYLRIVRGDATPEETAALVAALAALAARDQEAARRPVQPVRKAGNWRNPAHNMRRALPHRAGAWRTTFIPGS
jgi:hypothetical protein